MHGGKDAHGGGCFASGGRQLTLYLKVAITGPPTEFRWMVGAAGCDERLVAPLTFGIVRLGESAVNPPRRHTKARKDLETRGPWHYYRTRAYLGGSIFGGQWKHFDYRARS